MGAFKEYGGSILFGPRPAERITKEAKKHKQKQNCIRSVRPCVCVCRLAGSFFCFFFPYSCLSLSLHSFWLCVRARYPPLSRRPPVQSAAGSGDKKRQQRRSPLFLVVSSFSLFLSPFLFVYLVYGGGGGWRLDATDAFVSPPLLLLLRSRRSHPHTHISLPTKLSPHIDPPSNPT